MDGAAPQRCRHDVPRHHTPPCLATSCRPQAEGVGDVACATGGHRGQDRGTDKAEVSRDYWVSPRWVYELCRRFDAEGEAQHGLPIYWAIGLGLSRATISGVSSVGLSSARSGSVSRWCIISARGTIQPLHRCPQEGSNHEAAQDRASRAVPPLLPVLKIR